MSLFFDFYYIFKHLMLHFNSEMLFTLNKPSFKKLPDKKASKYLVNIIFPALKGSEALCSLNYLAATCYWASFDTN